MLFSHKLWPRLVQLVWLPSLCMGHILRVLILHTQICIKAIQTFCYSKEISLHEKWNSRGKVVTFTFGSFKSNEIALLKFSFFVHTSWTFTTKNKMHGRAQSQPSWKITPNCGGIFGLKFQILLLLFFYLSSRYLWKNSTNIFAPQKMRFPSIHFSCSYVSSTHCKQWFNYY